MNMQRVKQNRKQTSTFINVTVCMLIVMNLINVFLGYMETVMFKDFRQIEVVMDLVRLFGTFGSVVFSAYCFDYLLNKKRGK